MRSTGVSSGLAGIRQALVRCGCANHRMVVAVSGGGDSVGLACALAALCSELGLILHLAHFNHRTRSSSEHERDRETVELLGSALGLPLFVGAAEQWPGYRTGEAGGPEAYARDQRYEFLTDVCLATGSPFCSTAHTRSDQFETRLMRVVSDVDVSLLTGIPEFRRGDGLSFVRPALSVRGSDLRALAIEHGCTWREDSSNTDLRYRRNVVRHLIAPAALKQWPALEVDMERLATAAKQRSEERNGRIEAIRVAHRGGRYIVNAEEFYRLSAEDRLGFLYSFCHDRGLISRSDRPGHRFFSPLLAEMPKQSKTLLEGRGIRVVLSGPRLEIFDNIVHYS